MKRDIRTINDGTRIFIHHIDRRTACCRNTDRRRSTAALIHRIVAAALVGRTAVERIIHIRAEFIIDRSADLAVERIDFPQCPIFYVFDPFHQLRIVEPITELVKDPGLTAVIRYRDTARNADSIDRAFGQSIRVQTVRRDRPIYIRRSRAEQRCRLLIRQTACRTCRLHRLCNAVFPFDGRCRFVRFFCLCIVFVIVGIDDTCHVVDRIIRQCQADTDTDITAHAESARNVRDRCIIQRIERDTAVIYAFFHNTRRRFSRRDRCFIIDKDKTVRIAHHQIDHTADADRTADARLRDDTDLHDIVLCFHIHRTARKLCAFCNHNNIFHVKSLKREAAAQTDITAGTAGKTARHVDRFRIAFRRNIELALCIDDCIFTDKDIACMRYACQIDIACDRGFGTALVERFTTGRIIDGEVGIIVQIGKRSRFGKDINNSNSVHHLKIRTHLFGIESYGIRRLTELHRQIEKLRIFEIVGVFCRFFIGFFEQCFHLCQFFLILRRRTECRLDFFDCPEKLADHLRHTIVLHRVRRCHSNISAVDHLVTCCILRLDNDIRIIIHISHKYACADDRFIHRCLAVVVRRSDSRHLRIENIVVRRERYLAVMYARCRSARNDARIMFDRKIRFIHLFDDRDRCTDRNCLTDFISKIFRCRSIDCILYFLRQFVDDGRKQTIRKRIDRLRRCCGFGELRHHCRTAHLIVRSDRIVTDRIAGHDGDIFGFYRRADHDIGRAVIRRYVDGCCTDCSVAAACFCFDMYLVSRDCADIEVTDEIALCHLRLFADRYIRTCIAIRNDDCHIGDRFTAADRRRFGCRFGYHLCFGICLDLRIAFRLQRTVNIDCRLIIHLNIRYCRTRNHVRPFDIRDLQHSCRCPDTALHTAVRCHRKRIDRFPFTIRAHRVLCLYHSGRTDIDRSFPTEDSIRRVHIDRYGTERVDADHLD